MSFWIVFLLGSSICLFSASFCVFANPGSKIARLTGSFAFLYSMPHSPTSSMSVLSRFAVDARASSSVCRAASSRVARICRPKRACELSLRQTQVCVPVCRVRTHAIVEIERGGRGGSNGGQQRGCAPLLSATCWCCSWISRSRPLASASDWRHWTCLLCSALAANCRSTPLSELARGSAAPPPGL